MKITTLLISCLFMAAVAGCTAEITDPQQPDTDMPQVEAPAGEYELSASIGLMTKTELDNLVLNWEDNDVIKVWTGEAFTDYTYQGEGKFKGDKQPVLKDGRYVALYPAASLSGTKATFDIPAEQTFAVRKANDLPMVAVWGEGEKCIFHPVCSILEMPLTIPEGITLKSIDYTFNGAVGAGSYTYDYESGAYEKAASGDITLTGTFASGYVYNAVVPGDYSDGFTLTLADTEGCAMVLTATNGSELAAAKVQPLGNVTYSQLAPKFTVSYDDWAATATLVSTQETGEQKYWLSKTQNGEPLDGVEPVDMTGLKAGAAVKLYGYLCSENVAAAGVSDGDKLYFVSQHMEGNVAYLRSVEYTYHPDPLEILLFGDALSSDRTYTPELKGWGSTLNPNYTDDKAYGTACMRAEMPQAWAEMRLDLFNNNTGSKASLQDQAAALYNFEFYVKADKAINGNTYFAIRYYLGTANKGNSIMSKYQSAWQDFTIKGTEIPANTWTKVSIPLNQIWLFTKITTANYNGVIEADYQGYSNAGGRDGWLYSYKEIDRIYINAQPNGYSADNNPTVMLIDHFTIRKSTL